MISVHMYVCIVVLYRTGNVSVPTRRTNNVSVPIPIPAVQIGKSWYFNCSARARYMHNYGYVQVSVLYIYFDRALHASRCSHIAIGDACERLVL